MVMRFYLKGAYAQGIVNLEVYEVSIPSLKLFFHIKLTKAQQVH